MHPCPVLLKPPACLDSPQPTLGPSRGTPIQWPRVQTCSGDSVVASWARANAAKRPTCGAVQVKKMLSANAEAPLSIECIMDDKDVRVGGG